MYYEALNHIRDQLKNTSQKIFFISKIAIVISIYIVLIVNNEYNFTKPVYNNASECMNDHLYNQLATINQFLRDNEQLKNAIIITAGLIMDFLFMMICIRFICFHKNCRLVATLLAFYLIKGIIQNLFTFATPNDQLWGFPGVNSLVVSYYPINGFIYSNHVGGCLISFLEFRKDGCYILKKVAFLAIFMEAFVLIVTRAHYSIEIIGGLVFAHYLYIIIGEIFSNKSSNEIIQLSPRSRENLTNPHDDFSNLLNARSAISNRQNKALLLISDDHKGKNEKLQHVQI